MRGVALVGLALASGLALTGCSSSNSTGPQTGPLSGRVFDHNGALAHGAVVWAQPLATPWTGTPRGEAITDADGRFRIDPVPGGSWALVVDHGAAYAMADTVVAPTTVAELRLVAAATVTGHAGLTPLGRAGSIAVSAPAPEASAVSASDGSFTLGGLPAGTWPVRFQRDCYRDTTVMITVNGPGVTVVLPDVWLTPRADRDTVLCPGLP
jgi:Carboxypeptidase regulatory-like domain